MFELANRIQEALPAMQRISAEQWAAKPNPKKWSKQEILGHLIDSALNNLQRFTEIQHLSKPYAIRPYAQEGLVNANKYQDHNPQALLNLWLALNHQIAWVMDLKTKEDLNQQVQFESGTTKDLAWLMEDYVVHLNHHLNQIVPA